MNEITTNMTEPLQFPCSPAQNDWVQNDITIKGSFYQGEPTFLFDSTNCQDWSNINNSLHVTPSGISSSVQCLPALASSMDNIVDSQGFHSYSPPFLLADQSPKPDFPTPFASNSQGYVFKNVSMSMADLRFSTMNTMRLSAQTPENVQRSWPKFSSV
jgi:hypothetical protein